MTDKTQQQSAKPLSVVQIEKGTVEYVPYGGSDKVKLSVAIVQNLVAVRTKSGKTCSERDAIKFLAMCQAKRINPFEQDCFLIGYDGKDGPQFALITAHQTYLKRAELHPEFDGMKSGVIVRQEDGSLLDLEGDFYDQGQTVVGGWATVFFKNRKQPMHKRLRLERFKKPFGIWQEDPAGMICKCAEADALRSSFPTMLGGLYMREEIDISGSSQMAKPDFTPAAGSKPLFEVPAITEGNGGGDKPEAADANPEPTPIEALRNRCNVSKVKESVLLGYLAEIGATDGSEPSIDELSLEVINTTLERWPDVSAKILAATKGGAK